MSSIYLVRHGITPANKENRFAGRTDEQLHPEGAAQIRQVGKLLQDMKISRIFCGPLVRTVQSAEILSEVLSVPFARVEGFNEINIPHWNGLSKDEIRQQYVGEYPTWLEAPQSFKLPGCEALRQVQERAVTAVTSLLAVHPTENLVLVSHLIVLRCLVLYYQGRAIRDFRSIRIDNGSIIRMSEEKRGGFTVSSQ